MKNEIKIIQDYFIAKILAGEFDVIKIGQHVFELMIDEIYPFAIWIGNGDESTKPYHSSYEYFIQLEFTYKQSLKCASVFKKYIDININTELKREKMKQFNNLKKELGL